MRWILHLVPVKIIILESSYNWFKIDILRLVRPLAAIFSPVQRASLMRVLLMYNKNIPSNPDLGF